MRYVHLHDDRNRWIGYANSVTGELFTLAGNAAQPLTISHNGAVRRSKKYAKLRSAANRIGIEQNVANRSWESSQLASAPSSSAERSAALRAMVAPVVESLDGEGNLALRAQLDSILK